MKPAITDFNDSLLTRFYDRIFYSPDGCWYWLGLMHRDGYGLISTNHITYTAHRVSYMIHKGEIPKDMHICHSCDNPACVNPDHLWAGTNYDNILDRVKKGRSLLGSKHRSAKITEDDARNIKGLMSIGLMPTLISRCRKISFTTVRDIRRGITWKHVKI